MKLVFVSSTFKDMQYERDLLQTYAIPTLNDKLREYGERAYFGDLRWGVNTSDLDSDEGSRKVLKVCLDQIDNCKPYMIVLIGERYGWIPAQELIDEACVLKGIEKIKDISVTELEIDYGALLNPEYEGRILFYFRNLDKSGMTDDERRDYEAESQIHLKKVEELKKRIEDIYPRHIRYYNAVWDAESKKVIGLENFLTQVQSDLGEVLLRDLEAENNLPWQERCIQTARRYFEEVNKTLLPTENTEVVYAGSGIRDYVPFIYVSGEQGSGKSARVISSYCSCEGEKLAFSFGLDKFSRNSKDFNRVLIYKLESISGCEHRDCEDEELFPRLFGLLSQSETPISIFIDNADKDFLQELSYWEWELHGNEEPVEIKGQFMIAVQKELPFYPFFRLSGKMVMGELSEEDSERVLDCIVKSNHKEISHIVKSHILSKENSCRAAYLKSIVKRLIILDSEDFAAIRAMGDGMDNINKYMISIVDSTADSPYEILGELIEEAMDRINRVFVERLIGIFTHIPVYLGIEDIRGIFNAYGWEFNDLDFSLSVQMLENVLSYNPYFRHYKIKSIEIEKSISKYVPQWDGASATEYMLNNEELRPYAFRSAVLDATPEYLISVLKRSQTTDITESICRLMEHGFTQKAIDLSVALAEHGDFGEVNLFPSINELDSCEQELLFEFLCGFITVCDQRLSKDNYLLLARCTEARLTIAEHLLDLSPESAIEMTVQAFDLLREYTNKIDVDLVNRMYLLILKAVNRTKSAELFNQYIEGEGYLNVFTYISDYDKTVLKMKIYTEFSEIVGLLDDDLGEKYHDMAYELAVDANLFECKGEDFRYVSMLTEDLQGLLLGKTLSPFDLNLLRGEIRLDLHSKQASKEDNMYKAEAVWRHTGHKSDCITYWRTTLYYLVSLYDDDEPLDEDIVERYIALTRHLVKSGIDASDYVDIVHCAFILDYADDIENLLEAAKCHGELETFAQNMIRYYFIEEDMESFLALMDEFNEVKDSYMGAERIAAISIEAYFEMLTEEDEEE